MGVIGNVLDRAPTAPNKVWVTDITCIRTYEGWLFLAAVMDLYSRQGLTHAGPHQAIIDDALWEAVQAVRQRTSQRSSGERAKPTSPLRSLITDDLGRRYEPAHATKGGRRYRYYVSRKEDDQGHDRKQGRLPAEALERQVAERLASCLGSSDEILDTLTTAEGTATARERLLPSSRRIVATGDSDQPDWNFYRTILTRVAVRPDAIELTLDRQAVRQALDVLPDEGATTFTLTSRRASTEPATTCD